MAATIRKHPELRKGETFLGDYTIAAFNRLSSPTKRRGNVSYTQGGEVIPRARKLEETVYPVFIQVSEAESFRNRSDD